MTDPKDQLQDEPTASELSAGTGTAPENEIENFPGNDEGDED